MKTSKKIIGLISILLFISSAVYALIIIFSNPDLTQMRIFLNWWWVYCIIATSYSGIGWAFGLGIFKRKNGS
jgi:hypothetical protein